MWAVGFRRAHSMTQPTCFAAATSKAPTIGRKSRIVDRFDQLVKMLADGDLALYGEISRDIYDVLHQVTIGDLYVSCDRHVNWYEVIGEPQDGRVLVRVFSPTLRRGDYDMVKPERFAARVTARLFRRAKANGFRSIRAFS